MRLFFAPLCCRRVGRRELSRACGARERYGMELLGGDRRGLLDPPEERPAGPRREGVGYGGGKTGGDGAGARDRREA